MMSTSSKTSTDPEANVGMDDRSTTGASICRGDPLGRPRKPRGGQTRGGERPPPIYTAEPVNVAMLRDIASRRAAETFHLPGCTASLRECIYYFLRCVEKDYEFGVGSIVVCWRESSTIDEFGTETRRFSGCAPFLDDDSVGGAMERMRRLVKEGVPDTFVGKSFFGMPKLLRYIARTGLDV